MVSSTSSGYLAVLLIYMMSLSGDIKRLLNIAATLENRFISFERCYFFMNIPPEEGYKHLPQLKRHFHRMVEEGFKDKKVDLNVTITDWPRSGSVEFKNFSVRYRRDLDYTLKNLNFKIEHGTKLGILGRTGAGKSTLISSIFRYFGEFDGEILIDGVKIRDIDLQRLRSSMTIIPQDPILFNASIKKNLDPLDAHSVKDVEEVLKEIQLWDKFKDQGVNHQIEAGGANLSQGEKQLICFGRAMLENNKLILMDEATANIDSFTEKTIQTLVEEKFKDATILMIAHKLNTIMNCDKVLILDHGQLLEFGDLQTLKNKEGGVFNGLLKSADLIKEYC